MNHQHSKKDEPMNPQNKWLKAVGRSEEHTSELQSHLNLVCRLLLEKKNTNLCNVLLFLFFFFNDTATTEIYTLSLHDALPISVDGLKVRLDFWDELYEVIRRAKNTAVRR